MDSDLVEPIIGGKNFKGLEVRYEKPVFKYWRDRIRENRKRKRSYSNGHNED